MGTSRKKRQEKKLKLYSLDQKWAGMIVVVERNKEMAWATIQNMSSYRGGKDEDSLTETDISEGVYLESYGDQ